MSEPKQHQPADMAEKQPHETSTADPDTATDSALTRTQTAEFVPPTMGKWQRRLIMLSLCLTLFLSALDITIVSTALPTIAQSLHITGQQYAWVGSGFTLATTVSSPVWAKLSDICGRKPAIMASAAVFMAGSLVCALANSGDMLVGGRVVQGLGGGGSLVLVTILIGDLFHLKDRAKYYGMTGAVWGIASAVGPALGGVFAETAGWRWCFYINLPFDGAAVAFLFFALKVDIEKEPFMEGVRSLDWTGLGLIIAGTIMFLYGLELGSSGTEPWSSPAVICLIVFGFLLLAAFLVWEANFAKSPIIPFRIFQERTNIAAFAVSCLHSFTFISYDFFLPLYFQVILGLSPLISGVVLFALIIPLSTMTMISGLITRKTGNYIAVMYVGTFLMTLGSGLFISFGRSRDWAKIVTFQLIAGIGAGLLFQSPMIALQNYLKQRDIGPAMSAYSFLRSLFTSISIVIGTVLIQKYIESGSLTSVHGGGGGATTRESQDEYMKGLKVMWGFYCGAAGLTLVSTLFVKQKPKAEKVEVASDSA